MVDEGLDKCADPDSPPDGINLSKTIQRGQEYQKQAWVSHRPRCQKLKCIQHGDGPTMISARDTHFLITVANNDIYEHLGAVKDLRENHEHDLKHPWVISLDYVSIPMAITMRSATEYRERESSWDRTIQKVEAQSLLPKSTFELFQGNRFCLVSCGDT
ncbi:uncharacterized protein ARMOST_19676 [Armillaria ostoyae]|uniref:Uncharacterized protein n=1 Tax=Armillaria ostoyae TaxID=47428 RepID=A0A284S586_ARMOS|nr:uncharacterized protein ARMOST_19676 [Armillaria ostoyae]